MLPGDDKPWYKQAHLRKLNFITLSMVLFCMFPQARSQAPSSGAADLLLS